MIPFRIKKLTDTANKPTQKDGILWDLYVDDFDQKAYREAGENNPDDCNEFEPITYGEEGHLFQLREIMFESVKTDEGDQLFDGVGIYCKQWKMLTTFNYDEYSTTIYPQGRILIKTGIAIELPKQYDGRVRDGKKFWWYQELNHLPISSFAVAEIRPISDNLEQKGLFIENKIITGGEISFVVINHGHEEITIKKGELIAKMLIKPVYPSKMEEVKEKVRKEKFLEEEEPTEIKLNLPKVKLPHF